MLRKFFNLLLRSKFVFLIVAIISFLLGYFVTSFIANDSFSYYSFNVSSTINPSEFFTRDNMESLEIDILDYNKKIKDGVIDGKSLYLPSSVDIKKLPDVIKIENVANDIYEIKIPMKIFTTSFSKKSQRLSEGIGKCEKTMVTLLDSRVSGIENESIAISSEFSHIGYHNPYFIGLDVMLISILVLLVVLVVATKHDKLEEHEEICDNIDIFKTPFHKKYWQMASKSLTKVKNLSVIAVLFALMMCAKAIPLPSGFGILGISLTYLFFSVIAMMYGPIAGMIIGMMSDILGHFIFPPGMPFFPGYTLGSMLAGFTYGICFYKTKLSFSKCLLARLFVNLFVNVFLGSIWWAIINDFTMDAYLTYMMVISLPKNLIYLLPQSILLFILFKALANPLKHFNLIDYRISENVTIL